MLYMSERATAWYGRSVGQRRPYAPIALAQAPRCSGAQAPRRFVPGACVVCATCATLAPMTISHYSRDSNDATEMGLRHQHAAALKAYLATPDNAVVGEKLAEMRTRLALYLEAKQELRDIEDTVLNVNVPHPPTQLDSRYYDLDDTGTLDIMARRAVVVALNHYHKKAHYRAIDELAVNRETYFPGSGRRQGFVAVDDAEQGIKLLGDLVFAYLRDDR